MISPYDRVMRRTVQDGDCVRFLGDRTTHGGYGRIKVQGKLVMVHRVVWEHHNGPMPEGMTIDHVSAKGCSFRDCVNISHLECVTFQENIDRKVLPDRKECVRGHPATPENIRKVGKNGRGCKRCHAENMRRYRAEGRGYS